MPKYGKRKRSRSRRPRKRFNRRRRRYSRSQVTLVSRRAPIPDKTLIKLRYVADIEINPSLSSVGTHVFSANGMYDVDITGTGHQPLGFDQWMNFYQYYTVVGSKISARFMPTSSTPAVGSALCGIRVVNNSIPITTPETLREQNNNGWRSIGTANASNGALVVKKFSAKRFFGRQFIVGAADYIGTDSANPTNQAFYHVWVSSTQASGDTANTTVNVTVTFVAMLTERADLVAS